MGLWLLFHTALMSLCHCCFGCCCCCCSCCCSHFRAICTDVTISMSNLFFLNEQGVLLSIWKVCLVESDTKLEKKAHSFSVGHGRIMGVCLAFKLNKKTKPRPGHSLFWSSSTPAFTYWGAWNTAQCSTFIPSSSLYLSLVFLTFQPRRGNKHVNTLLISE